jgi:hypothetical protein
MSASIGRGKRMDGSRVNSGVVARGGALIVIVAMAIVVVKYLFDTYSATTFLVAIPATVLVVATAGVPYLVQRRRCAREEAARTASRPA